MRRASTSSCARCRATARENGALRRQRDRLARANARLKEKIATLQAALERTRRAGKRQAAPFSKGAPKKRPRRPGRRAGREYGLKARRPPPAWIDETLDARLPGSCPHCGGNVHETHVDQQFQTDLPPVRPHVTQFNVHIGACVDCGRRVQGRHPRQTSNALGAAASQVGPQVLGLAADLHKGMGLSLEKVSGLFDRAFGLSITRGGVCLGIQRLARVAAPTYHALVQQVRLAPAVAVDETGWKVAGLLEWLWVFVTAQVTVYAIQPGRGFEQAAAVLGEDFAGRLLRDGWAPYRKFKAATHQSCLTHLLGRCRENLETATRGAARFPHAVKRLLKKALDLRDRRDRGELSVHGVAVATGRLGAGMDRLLDWHPTDEENRKFLQHLAHERDALFTFLRYPGLPAANWPAEQAIRPAVVTRKVCGGNRTWRGAQTQQIMASILRTCHQQRRDPYAVLTQLLRSHVPIVAEVLLPESNRPPPLRF